MVKRAVPAGLPVKPGDNAAHQASGRPRPPSAAQAKSAGRGAAPASATPHIVGIGCSAGGLEALDAFLSHVPTDSGLAFVVVQHLDPRHESALAGLLQRDTPMRVVEAGDRMPVQPDCVYIIPPNKDLSLLHGVLHLIEPTERHGLRLPVDFFLRTLAEDQQEKAIAVILSGMGSDGVLGLRAIKEKSGLTLAQDPASARADGMPRSAIEAGLIDIVDTPEQLPLKIADFLGRVPRAAPDEPAPATSPQSALDKIVILLRDRTGNDFSLYKSSTLYRRIERRIALHQLGGIADYLRYLRENPQELDLLFKELLIGVTNFFRDPGLWELLRTDILPRLMAAHPAGRALRAWVPACSSGEEAYSLAIVFQEALEALKPDGRFTLQIYATDIDPDAVDKARKGSFPRNIVADVSASRLARFFVADEGGYRVAKDIRNMVIFAPQNVISDPPFTKLDILSCRNLLIYLRQELQQKLLPLFHYALNREGLLILGSAETVGTFSRLFDPCDNKARVFRRVDRTQPLAAPPFPVGVATEAAPPVAPPPPDRADTLGQLTDQLIQQNYAPAAVLVNPDGDILYVSGRTGKYLEPAAGKMNVNLHAMAREGLREPLIGAIHRALRQAEPVRLDGLRVGTNGGTQYVNVTIQGLDNPPLLRGRAIVVFNDIAAPAARDKARKTGAGHDALMQELQQAREELRVTHEGMQASVEELKSANEELQSTNEELQSTNEELTTSKEEMQSMNEELQTVNAELQSRVDDLTWERNDMANLLNSTEIATIFLDGGMKLRRYTSNVPKLFKLIPGDVGRPLSDIVSELDYPQLKADALEVLRTLVFSEKQVRAHDDAWYRVRIMPYRTQDNMIDGVVITLIDITETKRLADKLNK